MNSRMGSLSQLLIPAIFRSQADLARAIQALEPSAYASERALASFLSQVLTGARKCPPSLSRLIVNSTSAVLGSDFESEKTLIELRKLLGYTDSDEISQLLHRQLKADETVVIRSQPLDLSHHPRMSAFQSCMWDALLQSGAGTTKRYSFYVDDDDVALEHWNALEQSLSAYMLTISNLPTETPSVALNRLHSEKRLRVFVAPPHMCAIPIAAFDPLKKGGWADVYFWESFVENGDPVDSIRSFGTDLKHQWVKHAYAALADDQIRKDIAPPASH